jgi:hypothetical protein
MNKFKKWLIRKLGGYVHMSKTPIIYRERPVITLHGIAPAPDEREKIPIDIQREYCDRNIRDMIAKAIYDNRVFNMTETIDEITGRKMYKFTIKIVKPDAEVKSGVSTAFRIVSDIDRVGEDGAELSTQKE